MATPEALLQQACWVYAQHVLPPDADFACIETKIGVDDQARAAQRRALGIVAGQPDAQIVFKGRVWFVEFKAGAAVSQVQRDRHQKLEAAGSEVYIIRTVAQLAALFSDLQIPLRHHSLTPEARDMMWRARLARQREKAAATRAITRQADDEGGHDAPLHKRQPWKQRGRVKAGLAHRISLAMVKS